jgi:AP2 domain./HNH endonuclease.
MADPIRVPLSGGGFALIDAIDADAICPVVWHEAKRGRTSYAAGTVRRPGGRALTYMHRLVVGDAWPEVDHINGNGLDNRRTNLRPANRKQNTRNSSKRRRASNGSVPTSRFKGVGLHAASGLWRARIRVGDGKTVSLGYFTDEQAAARAYDEAARRLHGEFVTVNFPRTGERSAL